jgi:catechol 2,3-dioxygenase-like lactoylglutathione lyase family enzyme
MEANSGSLFNMDQEIWSAAAFVFDGRGPRRAPAIEVQTWRVPEIVGVPPEDAALVGVQAVGYAVADVEGVAARLVELGCAEVGRGIGTAGCPTVVLRDPTGVILDLVADPEVREPSNLRHVRMTCSDLDASLPWYQDLGWRLIDRGPVPDPDVYGVSDGEALVARLVLPDEATETHLVQWLRPAAHGRHPTVPYHAGLYRLALGVDDTRGSHEALAATGVVFDREPLAVELRGTPVPDMWICFLSDPDGIPYEFVQRPRSAFR